MADLASRKSARIVCAPDTHTSGCALPLRDVVQRCLPEPDGNRRSPTAADDHLMGRHCGASEKHTNAGNNGDRSSESIVGERQVQAYACKRALPPRPFPWRARVLAGCCLQVSSKGCPFAAGGTGKAGKRARVAEEFQRRAQRAHIRQVGKRTPHTRSRGSSTFSRTSCWWSPHGRNQPGVLPSRRRQKRALYLDPRSAHWHIRRACVLHCSPAAPSSRDP
jgi:hypothetical protein